MKKVKVLKRKYMPRYAPITWLLMICLLFDNLESKLDPFYLGALMVLLLFIHSLQWIVWLFHLFNAESPDIPELENLCTCPKPKGNAEYTGPHHSRNCSLFDLKYQQSIDE